MTTINWKALVVAGVLAGCGVEGGDADDGAAELASEVTETLAADLTYLRQEEKLARDVYRTLGGRWGTPVFENIAASEQQHTSRVASLLEQRAIPDPVQDDAVGVLAEPELASLYTALVSKGELSEEEALRVGAIIEDLDIADLRAMAARTDVPEVLTVMGALECGSRNHLRSFVSSLEARGASWTPSYLSPLEVEAITTSPQEQCGRK